MTEALTAILGLGGGVVVTGVVIALASFWVGYYMTEYMTGRNNGQF